MPYFTRTDAWCLNNTGDYELACLLAKSGSSLAFLSKPIWEVSPMRSEFVAALTAQGIHDIPKSDLGEEEAVEEDEEE
jgi:hypothetical protein